MGRGISGMMSWIDYRSSIISQISSKLFQISMATCIAPVSVSGGSHVKGCELLSSNSTLFMKPQRLAIKRKSNLKLTAVRAAKDDGGIGGGDFLAGFVLGGAVFGTLAYIWAPQIRRAILSENEQGFVRGRRPKYYAEYDEGLEKTKRTLNEKLRQLNSAIENVSTRLRGRKVPPVPIVRDSEVDGI